MGVQCSQLLVLCVASLPLIVHFCCSLNSMLSSSGLYPNPHRQLADATNSPACAGVGAIQLERRIVAIGDVHGNHKTMLSVLHEAGVIAQEGECTWHAAITPATPVLLTQVGDIVDRGPSAPQAWGCLEKLQQTAPTGSKVIRLAGNHELMWLEGRLNHRHKVEDTKERTLPFIRKIKDDICEGHVMGAYALPLSNNSSNSLLFVHAGLRPAMLDELIANTEMDRKKITVELIAQLINRDLKKRVCQCIDVGDRAAADMLERDPSFHRDDHIEKCPMNGSLYDAGPDRGGRGVGGVYWTDFRYLNTLAAGAIINDIFPGTSIMQVVGHTAETGSIRNTKNLGVICIDGGMQYGGKAYLEITPSGVFLAHEAKPRKGTEKEKTGGGWKSRDLTQEEC